MFFLLSLGWDSIQYNATVFPGYEVSMRALNRIDPTKPDW